MVWGEEGVVVVWGEEGVMVVWGEGGVVVVWKKEVCGSLGWKRGLWWFGGRGFVVV